MRWQCCAALTLGFCKSRFRGVSFSLVFIDFPLIVETLACTIRNRCLVLTRSPVYDEGGRVDNSLSELQATDLGSSRYDHYFFLKYANEPGPIPTCLLPIAAVCSPRSPRVLFPSHLSVSMLWSVRHPLETSLTTRFPRTLFVGVWGSGSALCAQGECTRPSLDHLPTSTLDTSSTCVSCFYRYRSASCHKDRT